MYGGLINKHHTMNTHNTKSIAAVFLGFVLGAALSIGTDFLLDNAGTISMENFKDSSLSIIIMVIIYRFIYNVAGCYLAAKLAPNNPMKHVIIIGIIGTILSVIGTIAMWDKAIPFYNIAIILISFPSAWLGGKLFLINQLNSNQH